MAAFSAAPSPSRKHTISRWPLELAKKRTISLEWVLITVLWLRRIWMGVNVTFYKVAHLVG